MPRNPSPDKAPFVPERQQHQHICTECGEPFLSPTTTAKACSDRCKMRRSRRRKSEGSTFREYAVDTGDIQAAMENAKSAAVDQLPTVAREILGEELRPAIREALTSEVLKGIGDMVDLLPLMNEALRDSLQATRMVRDAEGKPIEGRDGQYIVEPDSAERMKASALVLKYTLGQAGLAPQPEAPEQAPMIINFPTMPALPGYIEGDEPLDLPQLPEGHRECDICREAKPASEFVAASNRCAVCNEEQRTRIQAEIDKRTGGAT